MSCFWTLLLFLTFAFSSSSSEAKKSPPAVVVGTVYCDTCFHRDVPKHSHFIAGASVAIECKDETSASAPTTFRKQVKTDDRGDFRVRIPFPISKHARKIKGCSVKLISSNRPYCSIAAAASSSILHLRSRKRGTHIFSAGFFTFKPLNTPTVCDQKPSTKNNNINSIKKLNFKKKLSPYSDPNDPSFPPPLQDPTPSDPPGLGHILPPLPSLPPLIPPLPPLPRTPFLPSNPKKGTDNIKPSVNNNNNNNEAINQPDSFPFPPNPFNPPSLFPPNPFQPPPSLIPPVLPTPPPSIFPPIFSTPSPPPFFQLPPLPGLTPSPPPPPPPVFPIPLPPFPFQPTPGFPGVPHAEVSKRSSP